jgi:insertion element IS1 protein InsB
MEIICKFCERKCIKNGFQSNGNQRYKCTICQRRQQGNYFYNAYGSDINNRIIILTKEGLGIRSTARVLRISTATLLKRIVCIAGNVITPIISIGKTYEVDEMRTFIRNKSRLMWIAYALERESKKVVSFSIGKRTNRTLSIIIDTLKLSQAKKIYTDGLKNYKYLVPPELHVVKRFGTNHIERKNLTIRTHLKRLNRKTICFSRSLVILKAILKIYFWA